MREPQLEPSPTAALETCWVFSQMYACQLGVVLGRPNVAPAFPFGRSNGARPSSEASATSSRGVHSSHSTVLA